MHHQPRPVLPRLPVLRLSQVLLLVASLSQAGLAAAADQALPPAPQPGGATQTREGDGQVVIHATRIREDLRVDGRLDEPAYEAVAPIDDFVQVEPLAGVPVTERTEAWVLFDDRTLYVSGRFHDRSPERWVVNEMRRDIPNVSNAESFGLMLDTFHDRRNGFMFEVNALGGFIDGQITNEGFPPSTDWNPIWNVRVSRFEGGWSFEMAIPFRSLRYGAGREQTWGINMRRIVRYKNEEAYIVPLPQSLGSRRGLMQVSSAATLEGLELPPGGRNLDVKPFGISTLSTDRRAVPVVSNALGGDAGLDVKYGLTQNIVADLTLNTDFAQVEVDTQQVNLTRFSLFFPEKREFFLEGQGIFAFGTGAGANTGGGDVPTMFFSRQIGLSRGLAVPIIGGGRLTGKSGPWTIGALNIQTDSDPQVGARTTNFTALRLRRDILRRSAVGVLFTGRSHSTVAEGSNQTLGVDGAFSFFTNLAISAYVARTWTPDRIGRDFSYRGQLNYSGDRYGLQLEHLTIQERFNPEVGFVRRPNMRKTSGLARFSPRTPSLPAVRKLVAEAGFTYVENNAGVVESREQVGTAGIDFQNSDQVRVSVTQSYEFLARPFAIASGVSIPVGGYPFTTLGLRYTLGQQRPLAGTASLDVGSFYAGHKTTAGLSGGRLEITPQVMVEPGVSVNVVDLPFGRFTATLLNARLVYTMTPRLFFTGLAQYNSSNHTVSSNLRLRWEYLPGSELFVVYTDERNSEVHGFPELNNRAFVVKATRLLRF